MSMLTGKKIVVTGVANKKSIAWGCAQAIMEQGGEVIYTYQNDRMKKSLQKVVGEDAKMVELDVSTDEKIAQAFEEIKEYTEKIDGFVHSIAYANKEELEGDITDTSREGFQLAQEISSYSFLAIARYALPMLTENAGIVTLSYMGAVRAIPNYNMMGIAKASLESAVRYLAAEMAPKGIRVNGISAGAIKTLAVTGVGGYQDLLKASEDRALDGHSVTQKEVGNVCAFLLSPLSSGMLGDIVYVDKGVNLR